MTGAPQPPDSTQHLIERLDVTFALQAAGLGVWEYDPAAKQARWDERCRALYGLHQESKPIISYEEAFRYIHPDDVSLVREATTTVLTQPSDGHYDVTFRTIGGDDGRLRWVRFMGKAEFNAAGQAFRFAGVAQEVTQQVVSAANQQQLLRLFEQAPVGIATISGEELMFRSANAFYGQIVGRSPQQLVDKTLFEVIPEVAGKGFDTLLRGVLHTGQSYTAQEVPAQLLRQGRLETAYFSFTYLPHWLVEGTQSGILMVATEVTNQVLARQQLLVSEAALQNAVELAELGTWTTDADTGITQLSQRHATMFGLAETTIPYEQALSLVHPDDRERIRAAFLAAMQPGSSGHYQAEYRIINARTGQQQYIRARGETVFTDQDKPVRISGTTQDITAERESQLALESQVSERTQELLLTNQDLQRSNENLQTFSYIASHDLQEPLRKIQQFGDLLQDQYGAALGEGIMYLQRMQLAARRMSVLIEDLLGYSRIATQRSVDAPVGLNDVVATVLDVLEIAIKEVDAQIAVDELPIVPGDALQLGQLFQNLLSNALKFHRPGVPPQIRVNSQLIPADELPVAIKPNRRSIQYVCIQVADKGIGFDEKYVDRIFQVFQRLHGKHEFAGTGVGLAIVEKVVINHGGAITASSKPGEGATFCVYLPA